MCSWCGARKSCTSSTCPDLDCRRTREQTMGEYVLDTKTGRAYVAGDEPVPKSAIPKTTPRSQAAAMLLHCSTQQASLPVRSAHLSSTNSLLLQVLALFGFYDVDRE